MQFADEWLRECPEFPEGPPSEENLKDMEKLARRWVNGFIKPWSHPNDTLWLVWEVRRLRAEVARIQAGDLNPGEFHNLCHNLHERIAPVSRPEFEQGCVDFQNKLFGPAQEDAA